jgi:hypothetical protein
LSGFFPLTLIIWECYPVETKVSQLEFDLLRVMDPFGFETSAAWKDTPSSNPSVSPPVASTSNPFFLSPPPPPSTSSGITNPNDGFDDFDDFTPVPVTTEAAGGGQDDDFGDFGEFGDPEPVAAVAAEPDAFSPDMDDEGFEFGDDNVFHPAKTADWQPIRVKPLPDPLELSQQVRELLTPVLRGPDVDVSLSGEGIRQIESSVQLLVTPER